MYVPRNNLNQIGGATQPIGTISSYLSTYYGELINVSTIINSVSTIQNSEYRTLSVDQITDIISSLNRKITLDTAEIAQITGQINVINNDLNRQPDGYQQLLENAIKIYTSSNSAYLRISTLYDNATKTVSSLTQKISTLNSSTTNISTTLTTLNDEYSTFMLGYISTKSTIDHDVNAHSAEYTDYINQSTSYQSTIESLRLTDTAALSTFIETHDISTVVKNIGLLQPAIDISTTYGLSTSLIINSFSTQISMLYQAQYDIEGFISTYAIDPIMNDSVIRPMSFNYDLTGYFSQLDVGAQAFFTQKKQQLLAEVDEYRYAARERNSYLGVLTAELKIQKLNVNEDINTISFQIRAASSNNDMSTQSTLNVTRVGLVQIQAKMQVQIDTIAPLDTKYTQLDEIFDDEANFKASFIDYRSTLHHYERQVLEYPSTKPDVEGIYTQIWGYMDTAVTNVNTQISYRSTVIGEIKAALDPVKTYLHTSPLDAYTFPTFPNDYPYKTTYIQPQLLIDTNTSDYAILSPIKFI